MMIRFNVHHIAKLNIPLEEESTITNTLAYQCASNTEVVYDEEECDPDDELDLMSIESDLHDLSDGDDYSYNSF